MFVLCGEKMKRKCGQSGLSRRRPCRSSGLTLTEMTMVIAVVALLTVLSLPAVRSFFASLANSGNARPMISAALASARAIAAKEQRYAGIRFQTAYDPSKGPLDAPQYMIFIVNDTAIGPGEQGNLGCRAVEGLEPMKLPSNVGVMDLHLGSSSNDQVISSEDQIKNDFQFVDATTFSILFSPSGKMVIHKLWVRNKDSGSINSKDDIFNVESNVKAGIGMFVQDENSVQIEPSRNSFIIFERDKFKQAYEKSKAWSEYLNMPAGPATQLIYINPYTGTIVNEK